MSDTKYAGFWLRFIAYLIDSIIINVIPFIIIVPVLAMFGISLAAMENMGSGLPPKGMIPVVLMFFTTGGIFFLIFGVLSFGYYTVMEASKTQATFGKMAVGLKVTDMDGKPLNLVQSFLRNLSKIISNMTFLIGYIIAGITDKKQALHDMISGALVVKK